MRSQKEGSILINDVFVEFQHQPSQTNTWTLCGLQTSGNPI